MTREQLAVETVRVRNETIALAMDRRSQALKAAQEAYGEATAAAFAAYAADVERANATEVTA